MIKLYKEKMTFCLAIVNAWIILILWCLISFFMLHEVIMGTFFSIRNMGYQFAIMFQILGGIYMIVN